MEYKGHGMHGPGKCLLEELHQIHLYMAFKSFKSKSTMPVSVKIAQYLHNESRKFCQNQGGGGAESQG